MFDRHARTIYNHCFRRTASWELAEDVAAPDHAPDVASRVDDERAMAEVRAAIRRLPRGERDVVELVLSNGQGLAKTDHLRDLPGWTVTGDGNDTVTWTTPTGHIP